jgi:hypothetical protein
VRAAGQLLGLVGAGRGAEHQVEGVLGVDGEAADLGASRLERARYRAGFRAIAVQRERLDGGGGQVDRVPFEDEGSLGRVAEPEDRRGRRLDAVRVENAFLERLEGGCAGRFGRLIARYCDVDDAAGGDVAGE